MTTPKTYPNSHENRFAKLATQLNWRITKQGWPDFICYDDDTGQAIFVEVKPRGQSLSSYQFELMVVLSRLGAKCFISDGVALTPFDHEDPIGHQREDIVKTTHIETRDPTKEEWVALFNPGYQREAALDWEEFYGPSKQ